MLCSWGGAPTQPWTGVGDAVPALALAQPARPFAVPALRARTSAVVEHEATLVSPAAPQPRDVQPVEFIDRQLGQDRRGGSARHSDRGAKRAVGLLVQPAVDGM